MNKKQLLWQMTSEQFAAFDMHLYLDTHPHDTEAMQMLNDYKKAYQMYKNEYEALYGPISSDSVGGSGTWDWLKDPWPWEKEAN